MAACSWASALFPFGLPCVRHGFVLAWSLRPASWVDLSSAHRRHSTGRRADDHSTPARRGLGAALAIGAVAAHATPYLVADVDSGQVLMRTRRPLSGILRRSPS